VIGTYQIYIKKFGCWSLVCRTRKVWVLRIV